MKTIRRKDIIKKKGERKIFELIEHPFVEKLKYVIKGQKLYMIIDYDWHGYELFYYIKKERRFDEEIVKFYGAQLVLVLEHLHKNNFIFGE